MLMLPRKETIPSLFYVIIKSGDSLLPKHVIKINVKKITAVIDATFAVVKRKPEIFSGLYGIRTLDLRDTGAAL